MIAGTELSYHSWFGWRNWMLRCFYQENTSLIYTLYKELKWNWEFYSYRFTRVATWQNQQNECAPAKTQISLGIRPVWSESSLSAWRKLGSLATNWWHREDSDQTGWMPRLIWVFAGCTVTLLVLSCRGSIYVALFIHEHIKVRQKIFFSESVNRHIWVTSWENLSCPFAYIRG